MKRKITFIARVAVVAIAASCLCLIETSLAQSGTGPANGSTADNPHLRPAPPSANAPKAKLSERDKSFMLQAASAGAQEIEDGKMAEKQGQSADVKKIGGQMVADHSKANKQLVELAKTKGLGITTDNIKARNMRGPNFDKQYLTTLESEHKKDISTFEKEAQSGDEAEMRSWASKTLPILKEHLAMVENAMKKMK
jgi:putative membrane protein